jgi:hypothetical protein
MHRLAVATLLLFFAAGCGQSSSPPVTSPTPSCAYTLSINDTINGYPEGGNFSVGVTTTPSTGCTWNAASNASWIHVTSGASGTGNGTFAFSVDSNTGPARTGTLTAAGRLITFNQTAGAAPAPTPACVFALSIGSTIAGYPDGGVFTVGVTNTSGSNCAWTAAAFASWLHVTQGASGTGNGTVTFTADPNHGDARVGMLVIAGEEITFRQTGR